MEDPEAAAAARTSEEYVRKVLDAVGLSDGCEGRGYSHLPPIEMTALRDVVSRKSAAFWLKETPRSVMRGFRYDVITTGLPVRGRPIRLKGAEAEFVRQELEDNVAQGLYSRGMSAWGSWAFPTKEALGGRRRRTVVDYRVVNGRLKLSVYYIRRCGDVKNDLVGRAFLSAADGARGYNLLLNTMRAKEVLAV